jgi:predicted RNA methylase
MQTDRYVIDSNLVAALKAGDRVSDDEFDRVLPPNYERVSSAQWSSVRVARAVGRMLEDQPESSFIDLGCGVGKLCVLLALTTQLKVSGIERRPTLVQTCRRLAEANAPGQINFIQGDILEHDWSSYDILFLYNPFMEHKCSRTNANLIDSNVAFSKDAFDTYVDGCFDKLSQLREGQRVITYHGYGGTMPETLQMIDSEKIGNGTLRMWAT